MRSVLLVILALGCGSKLPAVPDGDPGPGPGPDAGPGPDGGPTPDPDAAIDPDAPPLDPDAPPMPDAPTIAPPFRTPVALPDDQLALAALQVLGANVPNASATSCGACHGLTRQQLRYWRVLSDTAMSGCFTDLDVSSPASARTMVECLRAMPSVPGSDFLTKKLGIYAAAAHLPWFEFTTTRGYGPSAGPIVATELRTAAGMPRAGGAAVPLTGAQFDVVAEWFVRGLPRLEETLPQDPAPQTCNHAVSVEVAPHVAAMQPFEGDPRDHEPRRRRRSPRCSGRTRSERTGSRPPGSRRRGPPSSRSSGDGTDGLRGRCGPGPCATSCRTAGCRTTSASRS
jgi:hypothetical protein